MPAWLFVAWFVGADPAWEPVGPPPPTPWARAGARSWRLCQEAEIQAQATRNGGGPRGRAGDNPQWRRRAMQCPGAPTVLVVAAQSEIVQASDLLRGVDGWVDETERMATAVAEHRERVEQALAWTEAALAESERRGQLPPQGALYYRAYALTSLGRIDQAQQAIQRAILAGDVERWRADRMAALVALFAGHLQQALRLAHRAVIYAPAEDRPISGYIWALVLDRAGAPNSARAVLKQLRRYSSATGALGALQSVLPVHERLFLRALNHQANGETSNALRLWEAYLARDEPEAPEKILARRHRDELSPPPVPVDGL